MLASLLPTQQKLELHGGEGASVAEWPPSGWPVDKSVRHFLDWCGRATPIRGCDISGQVALVGIRKAAECVPGSKPGSIPPPWLLLQFLPWSSLVNCVLEVGINPLPQKLVLVTAFVTAIESTLGQPLKSGRYHC